MPLKGEWIKGVAHWREGETAFISSAFTWRYKEVRFIAEYYRSLGVERIIAGGPGVFTIRKHLSDICEIPKPDEPGGRISDTLTRHNPMATRASYGCPVGCFFCTVPKMDGKIFTLVPDFPVRPILCDDNLSALPIEFQEHIISRYLSTGVPNPGKRLRQLMTGSPFEMRLAYTVGTPEKECARYLERSFHRVEAAHKCRGEWFKMSARDAIIQLTCAFAAFLDRMEIPEDYNKAGFLMNAMHCAGIPNDLHGIAYIFTEEGRHLLEGQEGRKLDS